MPRETTALRLFERLRTSMALATTDLKVYHALIKMADRAEARHGKGPSAKAAAAKALDDIILFIAERYSEFDKMKAPDPRVHGPGALLAHVLLDVALITDTLHLRKAVKQSVHGFRDRECNLATNQCDIIADCKVCIDRNGRCLGSG